MDSEVIWDESYSVGHETLDLQHRKILELCARAIDCLDDDRVEALGQAHLILNELQSYVDIHFRTEEQILTACHYPRLAEQQAEHREYSRQLTELLYAATQGMIDKAGICVFLSRWWRGHILESDKQYSSYIARNSR
jgi:hemerythrin-like metal-binding protein